MVWLLNDVILNKLVFFMFYFFGNNMFGIQVLLFLSYWVSKILRNDMRNKNVYMYRS